MIQFVTHHLFIITVLVYAHSFSAVGSDSVCPLPSASFKSTMTTEWNYILPITYALIFSVVLLFTFLVWYKNRMLRREIISRKFIQDKLLDANNRYQTLVENLPLSIFWKDLNLHYVSVNQTYARQFNRRPQDFTDLVDTDLFSPEIAEKFQSDDQQVIETATSAITTDQIVLGNQKVWIRTIRTPLTDANGAVLGILGIFDDVTKQKESEDQLLETQRFNESVLRSTLDMVYIYHIALDTVVYTNYHLSELLGYRELEIKAMKNAFHNRLIHPDDISSMNDMLARCNSLAEGEIESIEFRMHDVSGRWFWLQGRYAVFKRNESGHVTQIIGTLHDITERIVIENDLKNAFDRAQRYLDIVETVIVALDREGRITLINRKGLQVLGHQVSDLIGKNWFETCVKSDDRSESAFFFQTIVSADIKPLEYHENRIITANGQIRVFAWHNSFLTEHDNSICGMISAGDDITNRKEAEELLKTDKLRQNMLLTLNQLPDLTTKRIMDYALDTALILTKSVIGYLYFYSEEKLEFTLYSWSKNVMDACNVTDPQVKYSLDKTGLWGEAVRQRQPIITNDYRAENSLKKGVPQGHVELERHMNMPLFEEGVIVAVIGVGNKTDPYTDTDVRHLQLLMDGIWKIKKRIEIEEEVRHLNEELERKVELRTIEVKRAHEELERFFRLTPDLLCITNTQGVFIRCNKAWEQVTGYPLHEFIGKRYIDFIHPDDFEITTEVVQKAVIGEEIIDFTNRFRCADGSYRWIEWRSNTKDNYIFSAARDITEKKKNADALLQAKEDADRANHAKSFFLANMSHEIRTPLNAVIGYSELLAAMSTNEKERGFIESIMLAGRNLLRLINDILDLSKIEASMMTIHPEAVDLRTLFKETEQIFSFKIREKKLVFTTQMQPDLPRYLMLDEVRLRQILLNIVGNAVKFTDKGYITISVSGSPIPTDTGKIRLTISVADSGIGIQPDERNNIFEAFHQQKDQSPRFGGTGLGLAISKKLIEMMHGTITVDSVVGKGSTFSIALPDIEVAVLVPGSSEDYWNVAENKLFAPSTILIVDDNPSNRDMICSLLNKTGLTVITAQNNLSAVELAAKRQPSCIIINLILPVANGLTTAKALKTDLSTAAIPIIALSPLPASSIAIDEDLYVFEGRLSKPVSAHDLLEELRKHCACNITSAADDSGGTRLLTTDFPENLRNKARELLGAVKMDDIRLFSQEIITYGTTNNQFLTTKLGKKLAILAENFDITGVRKVLTKIISPE